MSDSNETLSFSPSSTKLTKLKYLLFLFEKLSKYFGFTPYTVLTTYLDDDRIKLDNAMKKVYELQELVDFLQESNNQLRDSNKQLEDLKFQITGKLVSDYAQIHKRQPTLPKTNINLTEEQAKDRFDQVKLALQDASLPLDVLSIIDIISETHSDIYVKVLRPLYENRLIEKTPTFWDIRMALNVISRIIQPRHYLEIGTRVGWSTAQVVAHSVHTVVYSFDMWIEGYGGVDNPGQDFVRNMMSRIITPITPQINFISGNSHDTLPQFFNPEQYPPTFELPVSRPELFDLITVDGDHNLEGAWMDLMAVMPHIAIGGAIVFDDIELSLTNSDIGLRSETSYPDYYPSMPSGLQSLNDVWDAVKKQFPNFSYFESSDHTISVGIGIRIS